MNSVDQDVSGGAFYDGRTVLLPDVAQLRSGDVLLTRSTPLVGAARGIQSKKIRMGTKGAFSHALICSEPPVLVEAIGMGVRTLSLARCYAHGWDSVRVLRHPDTALAQAASSAAQLHVGRDYSVRRALRAAFPSLVADRVADLGTFCSALVAQCYVGAGDKLFAREPIERTTPATIERIDELADVTQLVFYEGLAPRNIGQLVPLDAHSEPSPSARQTEISGRYAKDVMADAELVVAGMTAPVEIIPTHYGMLNLIIDGMIEVHGGLNGGSFPVNLYRLDRHLAELIASGELAAIHADLKVIEGEDLQKILKASFDPEPDIDQRAMRSQLDTTQRELEVRRAAVDKMEAQNVVGRSKAVAAYIALERNVIHSIEQRKVVFEEILTRLG